MKRELGFGYCGLICALCKENEHCVGCKKGGCIDKENCKNYHCCLDKGYNYCHECSDFPCQDSILYKKRIQMFCKLLESYGEEKLLDALSCNEIDGIRYHYENSLDGDYDKAKDEAQLLSILFKNHDVN